MIQNRKINEVVKGYFIKYHYTNLQNKHYYNDIPKLVLNDELLNIYVLVSINLNIIYADTGPKSQDNTSKFKLYISLKNLVTS